ncbi:hypothetical protein AB0I77_03350 [Streptomyces sp. NPDC050619]|uniref:hypothetical protein n=1 Tax=Streptomyces sp. NPDC050619 TaxID=3157214 RepID=UPI00344AB85A
MGEVVVEGGERVGGGPGGVDVEQFVDAVAAVGGVSGTHRGTHVPVLNGQRHQPARASRDVPGQVVARVCG